MAESPLPNAKIETKQRFSFSPIWLIPIISAVVAAFLFYKTEIEIGPTIYISFENGASIANNAKLIYRGVQVGTVKSVKLDEDLQHTIVAIELSKSAQQIASDGSQFWIVVPQISIDQISGLDTLLSGSYIQVSPGKGDYKENFVGLAQQPFVEADKEKPLLLTLKSMNAGTLSTGAPVSYRSIEVGVVTAVELAEDSSDVHISIAVDKKYGKLINRETIFWRTAVMDVDFNHGSPSIEVETLKSILLGGITFETPKTTTAQAVESGAIFELHSAQKGKDLAKPTEAGLHIILKAKQLGSIEKGDAVYFREVEVGEVISAGFEQDSRVVYIHVRIKSRYAALVREDTVFWNASGLHFNFSLFNGATLNVESLKALLSGGIAFATPTNESAVAQPGTQYILNPEPKEEWLAWSPDIPLVGHNADHFLEKELQTAEINAKKSQKNTTEKEVESPFPSD